MQFLRSATTAIRSRMDLNAQNSEEGRGINRWVIYKQLCIAKAKFSLNDRCLAVLSSLLSFYPEDEISAAKGLVVFPSNRQLSLRAHGMPESTLRRHLASLVAAGIISRKDSPTRKRYAHKGNEGEIELAFGFSIEPLLQKASEIAQAAAQITSDIQAIKRLRDEVSVARREISATYATLDADAQTDAQEDLYVRFRDIVDNIPRRAEKAELVAILSQFGIIRQELDKTLISNENAEKTSGTDAHIERHHYESLAESLYINNKIQKDDFLISEPIKQRPPENRSSGPLVSLQTVLHLCPDILAYAPSGIRCWKDLLDTSQMVSKFIGISQHLWLTAINSLGFESAGSVVAWILQKGTEIKSPGAYLNSLIQKARGGEFSISKLLVLR